MTKNKDKSSFKILFQKTQKHRTNQILTKKVMKKKRRRRGKRNRK